MITRPTGKHFGTHRPPGALSAATARRRVGADVRKFGSGIFRICEQDAIQETEQDRIPTDITLRPYYFRIVSSSQPRFCG